MEVHFTPDTQSRLSELASKSGRTTDELIEDAMAGYLAEVSQTRNALDARYDDLKSGAVDTVDGETFFKELRRREDVLLRNPRVMAAILAGRK
jgi:predicted transcriptional regulator